jgi:hypothetical protein
MSVSRNISKNLNGQIQPISSLQQTTTTNPPQSSGSLPNAQPVQNQVTQPVQNQVTQPVQNQVTQPQPTQQLTGGKSMGGKSSMIRPNTSLNQTQTPQLNQTLTQSQGQQSLTNQQPINDIVNTLLQLNRMITAYGSQNNIPGSTNISLNGQ